MASTLSVTGCLGDNSSTALPPPDHDVDSETLPYPAHGQELPTVTLPSPLHNREMSTTEYVNERETLLTFVFTRCPGPCHSLTSSLAHVQADAIENNYADEVVLFPTTFDPKHDTPDKLRSFSESNGADPSAENWHFLRPESEDEASEVINGTFGVGFEEIPAEQGDHSDHDDDGNHEEEHDTTFVHSNLLLLVNRDGIVERAYGREPPRPDEVLNDLDAVRDHFT